MCVIYFKFELYILYIVSLAGVYSSHYRGKEGWGEREDEKEGK